VNPPSILHRARGYLVVDKPPGVSVIPGREQKRDESLVGILERASGAKLWVVHRLDRDTSGALLFALDAATHRALSLAFETGAVEKEYLALVEGRISRALDLAVPLLPARRGRMRPIEPGERGKDARTLVEAIERFGDRATMVRARPLTGRTHQIRVHLRSAGHPLLVDHQYGRALPLTDRDLGGTSDEAVLSRTPLHAARLVIRGVSGVDDVDVTAPLPADMTAAIARLRRHGFPVTGQS
jgi:RluA family pseudouridine synthase